MTQFILSAILVLVATACNLKDPVPRPDFPDQDAVDAAVLDAGRCDVE